jgi:23S rRNA (cytidine1920-2'-O)/16S rRNA (cytidine1409-2'-O)-methyltransferase
MKKERIDKLLADRGFADSRAKAQALVMSGVVLVNERRIEKPSQMVSVDETIRIKGDAPEARYVGRGGLKLEAALHHFNIVPAGWNCLDVGSSTGGFTDCLLQHRAASVVALDVGTNQLAWKLRNDPRVDVRENTNARTVGAKDFDTRFQLIVMDVSFISVTKLLANLRELLTSDGQMVVLIKPQFEVGKGEVGKGGIVRDAEKHAAVVEKVNEYAESVGIEVVGVIDSPILGAEGNKEFLACYRLK